MRMRPTRPIPRTLALVAMTALVSAALAGCLMADSASASSLYVKDELTEEAAEVHVTFTQVQVLPAQAADAAHWATVFEGERTIDLLALSAPAAREKLADLDLAPGPYMGLRIATSQATAVLHDGSEVDLMVEGNVIVLSESFEVPRRGGLSILVDFDLDQSVDLRQGAYGQSVREMRTSTAGASAFDEPDDNATAPAQERTNWFGVCNAWHNSERARENPGAMENATAFHNLSQRASEANLTIEAYCDEQPFPGPPEHVPEHARAYHQAAMERRAAAHERGGEARGGSPGPPESPGPPNGAGGPPEGTPGNGQGGPDGDDPPGSDE